MATAAPRDRRLDPTAPLAWSRGRIGKESDELNGADVAGTRGRQVSARWGYNFSKRTQLYAVATQITNDSNAFQTFGVNPLGATVPLGLSPSRGADPTGYGIGLIHRF